jgi:CHAT domain-containing protein
MRVAVISDPVYTSDDRRLAVMVADSGNFRGAEAGGTRLARLPYSAIEARAVVRAFQGADIIELAGFNATARRVIELPSDTLDVLHFATHAVARRDAPEQSALFLSEYAADGSPLPSDRLTVDDDDRAVQRLDTKRQQHEREHLSKQVHREGFAARALQPVVTNAPAISRDQEFE